MGSQLSKRLSVLKKETDDAESGRIGLFRTTFLSVAAFAAVSYVIGTILPDSPRLPPRSGKQSTQGDIDRWETELRYRFKRRLDWLDTSWLSFTPGARTIYYTYAKVIVAAVPTEPTEAKPEDGGIDILAIKDWIVRMFANALLRLGFVFIALWPLWVLSFVVGLYALRNRFAAKPTSDILGVLTRGLGPFYSGIYGPLRTNNGISGTDLSCPSLACPDFVEESEATSHRLMSILKSFGAQSGTTTDLLRIILRYRDFPGFVESEQASEENLEIDEETGTKVLPPSATGFFTNEAGTIEDRAIEGLVAVLEAHRALSQYTSGAATGTDFSSLATDYDQFSKGLQPLLRGLSPLGQVLGAALTPNRAAALAKLRPSAIAAAYLSIEAGKILVYKRQGKGFVRISHYPELQARAILQSLPVFHKEFKGDDRLLLRHSIICSRRHGDFGRAFLPIQMPTESRALRDWLEILFTEPQRRAGIAHLVELDAHIEELSNHWKATFSKRLRQYRDAQRDVFSDSPERFWKGIVHKSVVLMPLIDVVTIALRGINGSRLGRVLDLIQLTRRYQTSISISARLPGFKRQAVEAQKGDHSVGPLAKNPDLQDRWAIVRRMLTRYNWLSTRVGDDAVPAVGYVQGIVRGGDRSEDDRKDVIGFDALVPLRQRRFEELVGKQWESSYYPDNPHPSKISIFIDFDEFESELKRTVSFSPASNMNNDTKPVSASG